MESHGKSLKVALSEGNGFFLESDSDLGAFPLKNGMGHLKLKGILTTKSKSGLPWVTINCTLIAFASVSITTCALYILGTPRSSTFYCVWIVTLLNAKRSKRNAEDNANF